MTTGPSLTVRRAAERGHANHGWLDSWHTFSFADYYDPAHTDSMRNDRVLSPGEIQLMRSGTGVMHSEFNPSAKQPAHLLQIWITPTERGLTPTYSEWTSAQSSGDAVKTLVISADGRDGSATIAQDASIYLLKLKPGEATTHGLAHGRGLWLHVAKGSVCANGIALFAGDAASLEVAGEIVIQSTDHSTEAILFDLK